jgi:hypothetical protein
MATSNNSSWDLLVDNRDGQLALVIEVKSKTNVPLEWVIRFRQNILEHGTVARSPYFLMAFPDKFYLWTEAEAHLDQAKPAYVVDASPILEPYLKRAGLTADKISGQSLEIIISSWLGTIIHYEQLPENLDGSQELLIDSGLYAALAGGRFEYEAVA